MKFPATLLVLSPLSLGITSQPLAPMIVTGDKLTTNTTHQPNSSSLIDSEELSNVPITSGTYQDLFALIAGGYVGNPTAGSFSLRGMNQDNVFGYVGTSSNALIAVLEDGAPLSSATLRYLPPVLWNSESAEVLRGPQALSHGPNSMGGAVLFHTTQPSFSWTGKALTEVSEFATYRSGIAQELILLPDELALRLSYLHQESDGQATNTFSHDDEFGATARDRYQARLLWHPAKNHDHYFDLSLVHDISRGNPFSTVRVLEGGDLFDREISLNTPSSNAADRTAAILNTSFALPLQLNLKSTLAIQRFDLEQSFDLDATPNLKWFVDGATDEFRFSEDLILTRREGSFQWLLGSYYEQSHYQVGYSGHGLRPFPTGSPFANSAEEIAEIIAAYGRFDWELIEHFHLIGGVRLNYEVRELDSSAIIGNAPRVTSSGHSSATDLLPQLGITWRPTEQAAVGIQLARGHRGGGISYAPTLGLSRTYEPESAWETELYARSSLADGVTISAALFQSWIENQQVPINVPRGYTGVDTLIENAASSHRYGAEIEAQWLANEEFTFHANLAYTQAEFTSLTLNAVDRSGQQFPNAPEWTASCGGTYRHPNGFFGSTLFAWASPTYSFVNSPQVTALESRQLLSARLGYTWHNASLYFFGSNLLDDEYALLRVDNFASARPVTGKAAPPRILGIGYEIQW